MWALLLLGSNLVWVVWLWSLPVVHLLIVVINEHVLSTEPSLNNCNNILRSHEAKSQEYDQAVYDYKLHLYLLLCKQVIYEPCV